MNWRDLALLVLKPWWLLTHPRGVGVRGIVTDDLGRVLFVRHSYGDRAWYLPGGAGGKHESPDEAVEREFWEETGLRVETEKLVGVYFWSEWGKRENLFIFSCRITGGNLQIDGGEIADSGWFDLDALPQPLFFGGQRFLDDWQAGRTGFGRLSKSTS